MHAKSNKIELPSATDVPKRPMQTSKFLLWCLCLALVTFWLYIPSFKNDFVNWDDQVYVAEQPMVLNKQYAKLWKTPVSLNYHPITMISLAMQAPKDARNLKPAPFIKLNVGLHIINSILVFYFILLLTNHRWWVAIFTALIFAIHPMHVESVVWISERKDVLYTFFLLLSCISYWYYVKKHAMKWLLLAGGFFLFSVLSKAMAVIIPILWLLIDFWSDRKLSNKSFWIEKMPFLAVSMFFGLMAISVQSGGDFGGLLTISGEKSTAVAASNVFTLLGRFQFASYGFTQYIFKFFYPANICAFYPYPAAMALSGIGSFLYPICLVGVLIAAIYLRKTGRYIAFGIGFYWVSVALVLQFISVGLAIMADRYTYVPYIGLAFAILYLLFEKLKDKSKYATSILVGIVAVFCLMLTMKTTSQIKVWHNSEALWTQVLQYYPTEDLALANRGNHRGKSGNIIGAMEDFEKALINGCVRADVYEGLGNSYGSMASQNPEKYDSLIAKAVGMYSQALTLDPNKFNTHFNLGVAQLQTNPKASISAFTNALKINPSKELDVLPLLGLSYLNSGEYQNAIDATGTAIQKGLNTDMVYFYRGLAYFGLGDKASAASDINAALTINPSNAEIIAKKKALGI